MSGSESQLLNVAAEGPEASCSTSLCFSVAICSVAMGRAAQRFPWGLGGFPWLHVERSGTYEGPLSVGVHLRLPGLGQVLFPPCFSVSVSEKEIIPRGGHWLVAAADAGGRQPSLSRETQAQTPAKLVQA